MRDGDHKTLKAVIQKQKKEEEGGRKEEIRCTVKNTNLKF
jgi:hypothetical protein